MSVMITVGQPALTINRGTTFMVTDHGGEIDPLQAEGVLAADTRFVSGYRLRVNGRTWERVSSAAVSHHQARLYLTNPILSGYEGSSTVGDGTIGLTLTRSADEGIHERFEVKNYAITPALIVLELEILSDFADLFEVKSGQWQQREHLVTQWDAGACELATTYQKDDFFRRFTYRVVKADSIPSYANGRLLFPIHLEPGGVWQACGHMLLQHGANVRSPLCDSSLDGTQDSRGDQLHARWLKTCTGLETPNSNLGRSYDESLDDMGGLRLFEQDLGPDVWVPAGGVPWFVTLFGRDSLIASLQSMMVHARLAEGALRTLAASQATERDDWRDAQPGKIVHEMRSGELSHFNVIPHARYYGTWDATPLFLITLHQAWRWLGDRRLIEDLLPAAERCLAWIDQHGDLDGDGFQEYQTYSAKGYSNMGWKDAVDAVVYPDGAQVPQPKGLCELQGYVYDAKLGMAEIYDAFDRHDRADALRAQAAELKRRFNEAFWLPDEGTYAFGLDPDKQPIRTIASNPGHCLWSGIVDDDKAEALTHRLMAPDMWSGWGIRTLSANHPAYDPFSYQRGSVWPHDNAIIAAGMKRYGFAAEANQVARGMLDAASYFESYRLPEVFAGLAREPRSFPVQYRGANVPQAWAAGSVFQFVQTMLGLEADVPNGRLYVDPTLPAWASELRLTGLKLRSVRLNLRFWREDERSRYSVEDQHGGEIEVCAPPLTRQAWLKERGGIG